MSKRIINLYHAFNFFFSLLFWAPIFYEYQRQMGLADSEIFGIQSIYYLSFCFLELPTGYLADRYGQRLSLRWAAVILAIANVVPIFFVTFSGFLVHWLLIALARSLMSGSASAYLYDFLEQAGETEYYRQTEGRARALSLFGRVVAWGAVGYLMAWHITLPYWLTTFAAVAAILVSSRFPEGRITESVPTFGVCWKVLRTTPRLWLMMGTGLAVFVLARLVQVNLFQPILGAAGYAVTSFGVVLGLTTLFEAAGSAWAEPIADRFGDMKSVFLVAVLMAASTALLPSVGWVGSFVLLSIFALACGVAYPVQRKLLNDSIPEPSLRATLLSVESLLDRLVCSGMAATVAVFMSWDRMDLVLELAGGLTLLVTAGLLYAYSVLKETDNVSSGDPPAE
jgi:MFS family permease